MFSSCAPCIILYSKALVPGFFAAKLAHAKLVHIRRALSSTVINSNQERFQAKPANLLIPINFSFPFRGGGA
jgi:hypothetical protein